MWGAPKSVKSLANPELGMCEEDSEESRRYHVGKLRGDSLEFEYYQVNFYARTKSQNSSKEDNKIQSLQCVSRNVQYIK